MTGRLALTVDARGAVLSTGTHQTLVVKYPGGQRKRIGLGALGAVILHGDVKLSTGVLQALARHDISVTCLSMGKTASMIGFTPTPEKHVRLRHCQHLAHADTALRLDIACLVVVAKMDSMAEFCRAHMPGRENDMYRAMRAASQCTDISSLLGVEGAATATYFEGLSSLYECNSPLHFNGRSRRPPQDEPNALMSLAYTLAEAPSRQLALRSGLDLQLGFLHAMSHRRQSLVLDLIEPARAQLDRWVYSLLVQRRVISPEMFVRNPGNGVRLTTKGRKVLYTAWFRDGHREALRPARALLADMLPALRAMSAASEH